MPPLRFLLPSNKYRRSMQPSINLKFCKILPSIRQALTISSSVKPILTLPRECTLPLSWIRKDPSPSNHLFTTKKFNMPRWVPAENNVGMFCPCNFCDSRLQVVGHPQSFQYNYQQPPPGVTPALIQLPQAVGSMQGFHQNPGNDGDVSFQGIQRKAIYQEASPGNTFNISQSNIHQWRWVQLPDEWCLWRLFNKVLQLFNLLIPLSLIAWILSLGQ